MIRKILKPESTTLDVQIPAEYIGRDVEILVFALEEEKSNLQNQDVLDTKKDEDNIFDKQIIQAKNENSSMDESLDNVEIKKLDDNKISIDFNNHKKESVSEQNKLDDSNGLGKLASIAGVGGALGGAISFLNKGKSENMLEDAKESIEDKLNINFGKEDISLKSDENSFKIKTDENLHVENEVNVNEEGFGINDNLHVKDGLKLNQDEEISFGIKEEVSQKAQEFTQDIKEDVQEKIEESSNELGKLTSIAGVGGALGGAMSFLGKEEKEFTVQADETKEGLDDEPSINFNKEDLQIDSVDNEDNSFKIKLDESLEEDEFKINEDLHVKTDELDEPSFQIKIEDDLKVNEYDDFKIKIDENLHVEKEVKLDTDVLKTESLAENPISFDIKEELSQKAKELTEDVKDKADESLGGLGKLASIAGVGGALGGAMSFLGKDEKEPQSGDLLEDAKESLHVKTDEPSFQIKTEDSLQEADAKYVIKKVLVAEDNEINQKLISKILESFELDITIAANGALAVQQRKENEFDLIFMDISMPVMDGLEAIKTILKYEEEKGLAHIPIVALTANALHGDRESFMREGADEYVTKPIRRENISNILEIFSTYKPNNFKAIETKEPVVSLSIPQKEPEVVESASQEQVSLDVNLEDIKCEDILIFRKSDMETFVAKSIIGQINTSCDSCDSLEEFYEQIKKVHYSLVMFDYEIPNLDPEKLSKILKEAERVHNKGDITSVMLVADNSDAPYTTSVLFTETVKGIMSRDKIFNMVNRYISKSTFA